MSNENFLEQKQNVIINKTKIIMIKFFTNKRV